ncbi:hypothetical protein JR316_0008428 [Psilocybe cubensis]|uniref:Uncharacterized protein n=1 Tax=Psilocybe cubensis TaxID=181762 RepID=A0ACB8GWD8_PSICU|nr:hypothetical protein JR316_0008428 [Psilocybe cubensis]KAH9479833.1 hypothetical protein JR316_0008428 [Psilocybe cubensis]
MYPGQFNIPTTSPAIGANSNDPAPSSWQGYFPDMHLQMYASPMSIAYQNLSTPMMQPKRGNSLPAPPVSYPSTPMHALQPMTPSQSVPQSYHTLPDSMRPTMTPGRIIQPGLPTAQQQESNSNTTPIVPINPYPMQPVTETKEDAFVASDPYHPQKSTQGAKEISSFDEVEMPGPPRLGYYAPANTSLGHPTQASAYAYAGGRPQDRPGSSSRPTALPTKTGKDIASFDEIETPGPAQNKSSIVQGFAPIYGPQVASYGWPNGRVSDTPGNMAYPLEQDGGWGLPAASGSYASPAWRTASESGKQRRSTYGSNFNINTQHPPTPALGQEEDERNSSKYTGYLTTPSLGYTSLPTVQTYESGWPTPLAMTKTKANDDPSSRISSWGTYPGRTPSTPYSTSYSTPAIPSPSGWGSEYEADYSPSATQTRGNESDLGSSSKANIKMPEPQIPQILPPRLGSSLETTGPMPVPHIPQIIPSNRHSPLPNLSEVPNVGEKTNHDHSIMPSPAQHASVSVQTSPKEDAPEDVVSLDNELSPIQPNEEPLVSTLPLDSPTPNRNEIDGIPTSIPARSSEDERLSSINEHIMASIGGDNEENSPNSAKPTRTPSPLPVPSKSTITMPIPQIPLIVPPRWYNATRPDPPDLSAPEHASNHSSSESISKPEPSSPAKSSFSSWTMPSLPSASVPYVPDITLKPSVWTRAKNFFRWPFNESKPLSTKPQFAPNPIQPPFVAPYILPPPPVPMVIRYSKEPSIDMTKLVVNFVTGTVPRQVYLHFLLRLPSLYFSRVARIFEEADLTLPEIKKMALETASTAKGPVDLQIFESSNMPLPYTRLKSTWEGFIDSVMREWKTFNIISLMAFTHSAILTILQIDTAADDPITRYTAIASLICALISLLFGCMYIIRFGTMRKTYKAAEWALEAKKTKTVIWWNVWVLLAMPAIWLTWSIILYIACTMSFVWRTSSQSDSNPIVTSKTALLTVRIVISSVLGLGIIYGGLILSTFSRYGSAMDKAWKKRVDNWIVEKYGLQSQGGQYIPSQQYPSSYYHTPYIRPGTTPLPPGLAPEYYTPYVQQPGGPLPTGFVPQTFGYPFQGSTPYATPTRLPPSGQYMPYIPSANIPAYQPSAPYTPFIPPVGFPSYGYYPPAVPSYPPSPTIPPVIPPVSSTPFIPPLETPSSSPAESYDEQFFIPNNLHSGQSSGPRRTDSDDWTHQNNQRRSSTNAWNYSNEWDYSTPNPSTRLGQSTSSSDMDSVTRTNTQHNAGPIPDHSSPSTSIPTDRPPVGSNSTSGRRRRTRPTVSTSSPTSLPTGMTSADANGTSPDVNTLSPLATPASAHVTFRSPLVSESAPRNQEGPGHTVRTLNTDDDSAPNILDFAQRSNVSSPQ